MNSILVNSSQVEFYTFLKPIFNSINNKQIQYNWLLTDLELNWIPEDFLDFMEQYKVSDSYWDRENIYWITGEQLTAFTNKYEGIQFIWGILSGFDKSVTIDINNLIEHPFADGNPNFWIPGGVATQHSKAELEIVCWDSSLTLLISNDQEIVKKFSRVFIDARDLDEYNSEE
ncbi:MAG: hypothetical protein AB7V16_13960 [Vulcanibacillus sp.]